MGTVPKITKLGYIKSPPGEVKYAWLNKPAQLSGKYEVTLRFDANDPEVVEFQEQVEQYRQDWLKEAAAQHKKKFPDMPSNLLCEDEEDGWLRLKATSTFIPEIYDAKNNKADHIADQVRQGAQLKVIVAVGGYSTAMGTNIKGYLNKVQVVSLSSSGGMGFDEVENGYVAPAMATEPTPSPDSEDSFDF